MSRRQRPKPTDLISTLTVGQLRALIGDEIEENVPIAETDTTDIELQLRSFEERFEEVVDFMLDVYEWWPKPAEVSERAAVNQAARLDRFARAFLACREPDGTDPTQEAVASHEGVTDRYVRMIGWAKIQRRAVEIEEVDRNQS